MNAADALAIVRFLLDPVPDDEVLAWSRHHELDAGATKDEVVEAAAAVLLERFRDLDCGSVLGELDATDYKFVEGICAGMTGVEAARYAGSQASTRNGLSRFAAARRSRPEIQRAIRDMRELHRVDDEGLWHKSLKALSEVLDQTESHNARVRAAEAIAKLQGRFVPARHEHVVAHVNAPSISDPAARADLAQSVRVVLRGMEPGDRVAYLRDVLQEDDLVDLLPALEEPVAIEARARES